MRNIKVPVGCCRANAIRCQLRYSKLKGTDLNEAHPKISLSGYAVVLE